MTQHPGPNGYIQYALPRSDGKRIREYLHQWVLLAFVGPRPDGWVARHINDDRLDNRVENLRWGSRSENGFDAWANGRRKR